MRVTGTEQGGSGWWREAAIYQVYPRSFADGDGDGVGDLTGLRERLDHVAELGADAVWICPWYPSPLRDGGYDVADHRGIHPTLGTLNDADALIARAHELGLRVIIDVVPNHTSVEHRWFRTALEQGPTSDAAQRYHVRRGAGPDGQDPPNGWTSVFGGPAWTQIDDGWWYLHLFDDSQPDLDWNDDRVRREFDDILRFWLERDVDGFRIDVAQGMVKAPGYPEAPDVEMLELGPDDDHPYWDRPEVHGIARHWRELVDEGATDGCVLVAEAWVGPDVLGDYLRPGEYDQAFNFDFLFVQWDRDQLTRAIDRALRAIEGTGALPTWMLSNHDVMRHATRLGLPPTVDPATWPVTGPVEALDPDVGLRRARSATLLTMALPGSIYLYQGEELGLPEAWDLPTEVLTDPTWHRSGGTRKGRDGCRVPLPWTTDAPAFGFLNRGGSRRGHDGWEGDHHVHPEAVLPGVQGAGRQARC